MPQFETQNGIGLYPDMPRLKLPIRFPHRKVERSEWKIHRQATRGAWDPDEATDPPEFGPSEAACGRWRFGNASRLGEAD